MRCDVIAQGVITAARKIGLRKPVVIRLQGTKVTEATEILNAAKESGFRIVQVSDLDSAALTVVKMADIVRQAEEISMNVSFTLPL